MSIDLKAPFFFLCFTLVLWPIKKKVRIFILRNLFEFLYAWEEQKLSFYFNVGGLLSKNCNKFIEKRSVIGVCKPPKNACVNFKRRIRTKKQVYSHFQRSRKKHQSNIKVSPPFFFPLGHKKVGHTHTENWFLSPPTAGPLFVHTQKKMPKMSPFRVAQLTGENV